mgnify:CR=1 FL=1
MAKRANRGTGGRALKVLKASDEDIAAASRRAIDGTLDDTDRLLLFLSGAGGGSGLVRCGSTCKGNPRRPDCVCGLVPLVHEVSWSLWWRNIFLVGASTTAIIPTAPLPESNFAVKNLDVLSTQIGTLADNSRVLL